MRRAWALFVLVAYCCIASALLITQPGTAADPGPTRTPDHRCQFPDRVLQEGLAESAAGFYAAMLEATPGLDCAQDGYIDAGLARTPAATQTPTATPTPSQDELFAPAKSFDAVRHPEEAEAAIIAVLTAHPEAAVPTELAEYTNPAWEDTSQVAQEVRDSELWDEIRASRLSNWVSQYWANDIKVLPGVATDFSDWVLSMAGVAIAVWLFYAAIQAIRTNRKPALDIQPFDPGSSGAEIGTALAEAIQDAYIHIDQGGALPSSAKLVVAAEAADKPKSGNPKLEEGPTGAALALLDSIKSFGATTYLLAGTMVTDRAKGAGIIVELERGNSVVATQTLWFGDFLESTGGKTGDVTPEAEDFLALAQTAAVWLYSQMAEHEPQVAPLKKRVRIDLLRRFWGPDPPLNAAPPPRFHTKWKNWKSYAFFRNAAMASGWQRQDLAFRLLNESLREDPYFLPARANLGMLQFQNRTIDSVNDPAASLEASTAFLNLLATLWNRGEFGPGSEKSRAKLLFNLLAAIEYRAGREHPTFHPETQKRLRALEVWLQNERANKNSPYIENEQALQAVIDILLLRAGSNDDREAVLERIRIPDGELENATPAFGSRQLYEAACVSCAAIEYAPASETDYWAKQALAQLRAAVEIDSKRKKWAAADPSLSPLRDSEQYQDVFLEIIAEAIPDPEQTTRNEHVLYFGDERANRLVLPILQGASRRLN